MSATLTRCNPDLSQLMLSGAIWLIVACQGTPLPLQTDTAPAHSPNCKPAADAAPAPTAHQEFAPQSMSEAMASDGAIVTPRHLIWVRDKLTGQGTTFELTEQKGVLREIGRRKGIYLWRDNGYIELKKRSHTVDGCSCDNATWQPVCNDTAVPSTPNRVQYIELVKNKQRTLLLPPSERSAREMHHLEQNIKPLATLGPLAAFQISEFSIYPCAPHGNVHTRIVWVNMRNGKPVDMLKQQPVTPHIKNALFERICDQYVTCQFDDSHTRHGDTDYLTALRSQCAPKITQIIPIWTMNGFARQYIAETPAPFNCFNGYNAYSITDMYGAVPFTGNAAQWADVPVSVSRFVKAMAKTIELGGYSSLPAHSPPLSALKSD
ncbi:MAG: hypothetical protein JXX14_15780 [Deltaproteobacteria bacterium]|nr:hypothetical protein [Deltaproteobacteria bacterium]